MKKLSTTLLAVIITSALFFKACDQAEQLPGDVGVPVVHIELNKTTAEIPFGDTLRLIPTLFPENATNRAVNWLSTNPAVATVVDGLVTAVSEGSATIVATSQDGNRSATCVVAVGAPTPPTLVTHISFGSETFAVHISGSTAVGGALRVLPWNATNSSVIWNNSNPVVATLYDYYYYTLDWGYIVLLRGFVRGVSVGTTTITATTVDGSNLTATAEIEVYDDEILPNRCNTRTPGWGESLGTISWGTIDNTNIESGTSPIIGTNGRPNQIWSGAVFASACREKTTFRGSTSSSFNADCRGDINELVGDFFSWCAVYRFADQFCPYPWRVPTREDFVDLDLNLGGNGLGRSEREANGGVVNGFTIAEQLQWYTDTDGSPGFGFPPQIGGVWGGAWLTSDAFGLSNSGYWSLSRDANTGHIYALAFGPFWIDPASTSLLRGGGQVLRCVRN